MDLLDGAFSRGVRADLRRLARMISAPRILWGAIVHPGFRQAGILQDLRYATGGRVKRGVEVTIETGLRAKVEAWIADDPDRATGPSRGSCLIVPMSAWGHVRIPMLRQAPNYTTPLPCSRSRSVTWAPRRA